MYLDLSAKSGTSVSTKPLKKGFTGKPFGLADIVSVRSELIKRQSKVYLRTRKASDRKQKELDFDHLKWQTKRGCSTIEEPTAKLSDRSMFSYVFDKYPCYSLSNLRKSFLEKSISLSRFNRVENVISL